MPERVYGSKYDKNLNTTQIAALVRAEIKAAVKAKELPAGKYSVRTSYYSGGSSISVRISGLTGDVFEPEYLERGDAYLMGPSVEDETGWHRPSRYVLAVRLAVKKVEGMLAAYNHDGSDSMTDYFDVKFHGSVSVDTTREEEQAARAALATKAAAPAPAVQELDEDQEVLTREAALSNVVAFRAPVKPSEDPEQVRFLREAGVL